MKILILTQWYFPEPVKLFSDLAESLAAMGHEVTVLTGFPNWPEGKVYSGYRQRLVCREDINGVHVIRIPLYPDHSGNPLKRAANFLSFLVSSTLLGPLVAPKVDVMYVIHPPITVGIPAWVMSRLRRIPFNMEIQDMWPETLSSTGMLRNKAALGMVGWFSRWVYDKAANVRVISSGFRLNLLTKGVPDSKIQVISNWVDTDFYRPVPRSQELMARFHLNGRFNILYAGAIGLAQGLEVVLDAAAELQSSQPEVQFVIAGEGVDFKRLRESALARGLDNVRFLGRLPGEMMPDLYACADVLFLHLRPDPLFAITIPHKVFTYLAAGKPVLVGGEGDVVELVAGVQAGLACKPGIPIDLVRAVRELYEMQPEKRAAMGGRGRALACSQYSRSALVGKISEMIESSRLT